MLARRFIPPLVAVSSIFAVAMQGCGRAKDDSGGSTASGTGDGDGDNQSSSANGDGDGDSGTVTTSASTGLDVTTGSTSETTSSSGQGGQGPICETASSDAQIPAVYLAFAFDVSGSMGKLDSPRWWHDPTAKWEPIVEATSAFFENPASTGISASMALFPAADDKCDDATYLEPEVPMTALPSEAFSTAFSDYEAEVGDPLAGGDWRGGTPTSAALGGVAQSLSSLRRAQPDAKFAIVVVTDGLPQDCSDDIDEAVATAGDLFDDGLSTYVIGIQNPTVAPSSLPAGWDDWGNCDSGPGGGSDPCTPPENLTALDDLASAGGTEHAFLIDTGDPTSTQNDFFAAVEAIRKSSLSCSIAIPENPNGGTFEKDNIDVRVTLAGQTTRLAYDAECGDPLSWHYDDESSPSQIELCDQTCSTIKADHSAQLDVDFLCEPRPDVIR